VNWSAAEVALFPLGVVTVTSTEVPASSAGDVVVIWVALTTVKVVGACVPKSTPVAPLKLVPVIVTGAPPARTPDVGLKAVTAGTAS